MTTPAPRTAEADTEQNDGVHTRCMTCLIEPARAICGVELHEADEVPAQRQDLAYCPRCVELWKLHREVLHAPARVRQVRRL